MKLRELQEQRAKIVADMRGILDAADEAARDLTAEENGQYETLEKSLADKNDEIEKAEKAIERREKIERYEQELAEVPTPPRHRPAPEQPAQSAEELQMAGFRQWLLTGRVNRELAALQMDSDTGGGVLTLPEQFVQQLIDGLDDAVQIRGVSTVIQVPNAASLGAPSLDNDPADSDWTVELGTGNEDSTMDFGKRQLHPHPVAKLIKVSKTLLRKSVMPVDQIVRSRLNYKMAVTQEKAFLTGTGSQRPLGIFTASSDGISTGQDVSTDNTTTAVTADGLINAKYALKSQYHSSANLRWIFHRDTVKMIRKLKDGNGQYLWQPGLAGDRGNTILDVPYLVSEFAPNTFTTGLYVGIIGDFSHYWIAEALNMTIEVASELYMASNQDGYFLRAEVDAMPTIEEAFVRVTLA